MVGAEAVGREVAVLGGTVDLVGADDRADVVRELGLGLSAWGAITLMPKTATRMRMMTAGSAAHHHLNPP